MKLIIFLTLISGIVCISYSDHFNLEDVARFQTLFDSSATFSDLQSAYYSVNGLALLGKSFDKERYCQFVHSLVQKDNFESIFFSGAIVSQLDGCQLQIPNIKIILATTIKTVSTTQEIYRILMTSRIFNQPIDSAAMLKLIKNILKKDDSPISYAYAFHAASLLSGDVGDLLSHVEDIFAQADEVDKLYLQFENILTTAQVAEGIFKLSSAISKSPGIPADKLTKLTTYLLSRKHVYCPKSAYYLLSALFTLNKSKFQIPVVLYMERPVEVTQQNPLVSLRVSNVFGNPLPVTLTITATSMTPLAGGSSAIEKQLFKAGQDSRLMSLDVMKSKPSSGFYNLHFEVSAPENKQVVFSKTNKAVVKVLDSVSVDGLEIGVGERDRTLPSQPIQLQHPHSVSQILEVDEHQKLFVHLYLMNSERKGMTASQVFLKFSNVDSQSEILFLVQSEKTLGSYKFDLDVTTAAASFGGKSGQYSVELLIGDAILSNSISWTLAKVKLTFPSHVKPSQRHLDQYEMKPEIKHQFGQPEKLPSALITTVFLGFLLVPIAIMIVLWLRTGISLGSTAFSLYGLGFHLALAAIFSLYFYAWMYLNMFSTCGYLIFLSIPLFFFGNRLLAA